MKFKIVKNAWWMFWAVGMAVWPVMLLKKRDGERANHRLYRHELQHVYQQVRIGRVRWFFQWIIEQVRHGTHKNKFEVESEEHENDELTELELEWYRRGKIDTDDIDWSKA